MSDERGYEEGEILVLGVGNRMNGDDGVGPYVAERLAATGAERDAVESHGRLTSLDCGTVPENYTSTIRRMCPRVLVIVDAARMGLPVGDCRVIASDRVGSLGLSTHSMPLSLFMTYVAGMVGRIILMGIQPGDMSLGSALSPQVRATADELVSLLAQRKFGEVAVLD